MSVDNDYSPPDFDLDTIPSVFAFSKYKVRVIVDIQENPWFVAQDVCKALKIRNSRDACSILDEDEKDGVVFYDSIGRKQKMVIVNEPGLYRLIFRSKKEQARSFQRWVVHEVLPALRQTGRYAMAEDNISPPNFNTFPTTYPQLMINHSYLVAAYQQVQEEKQQLTPKAAFYDRYRNTQGKHGLQATAKIIGLKPNIFIQQLIADGLLFRRDKCLTAGEAFIKLEWFTTKLFEHPETRMPAHQTMVTPKGLLVLAKRYGWRTDLLTTPQHQ